jgi:hypothetical protein
MAQVCSSCRYPSHGPSCGKRHVNWQEKWEYKIWRPAEVGCFGFEEDMGFHGKQSQAKRKVLI